MMLRATKVRIYPTPEQADYLNAQFGAVRFAYNKALHIKKHAYQRHGVNLSPRKDLKPLLSVAKKSRRYAWLKAYDAIALQQAVINLDMAFSPSLLHCLANILCPPMLRGLWLTDLNLMKMPSLHSNASMAGCPAIIVSG